MSTYAWATDVHLDFLQNDSQRLIKFAESLLKPNPTGIFLTGDISTAKSLVYHLSAIEKVVQRPIYFVLGNHDYYGGSIAEVRTTMHELGRVSPFLRYMPTMPYYALTPSTAIVGHDGWYDAFFGNWKNSSFRLNDWNAIREYAPHNGAVSTIVEYSRKLAHEGVLHVQEGIKQAVRYHKNVIVLTHYPPFREAHIFEGKQGDDEAAPWFTSKLMGDMLHLAAKTYPHVNFTVLAGHTHGKCSYKQFPNLYVHVGGAEYNLPVMQGTIEVL